MSTQRNTETQEQKNCPDTHKHTGTYRNTRAQELDSNTHKHTGTQEHGAHEHRKTQEHRDTLTIPINTGSTPASPRHLLLETQGRHFFFGVLPVLQKLNHI